MQSPCPLGIPRLLALLADALTHRLHLHYCTNGEDRSGRPPHPTCKLQPIVWATFQGSNDYGNCRKSGRATLGLLGTYATRSWGTWICRPSTSAVPGAAKEDPAHRAPSNGPPPTIIFCGWVSEILQGQVPAGDRGRDRAGGVILAILVMLLRTG